MVDLGSLTVRAARDLVAARQLSATELAEATLRRIDETEPVLNAYVTVDPDFVLDQARRVDSGEVRGPLAGVPFGAKDILETEDLPTEAGSRLLAGNRPGHDAESVRRLREAGAILVGKHRTHEFAGGQDDPGTINPWAPERYAGGSSVGGGVSVQAGSSLAALGTDAGGSVRKPACVTGTVGLKATHGRVSGRGTVIGASASSLDHVGAFARTAEDAGLLLQVLAGHDPATASSIDEPVPDYGKQLDEGARGLRLGVLRGYPESIEEPIATLFEGALVELGSLGAELIDVELPMLEHTLPVAFTILPPEAAAPHRRWLATRPDDYHPRTRRLLELGLLMPGALVEQAQRVRTLICDAVATAFRDRSLDVLVMPTLPVVPPRLDGMIPGDFVSLIPLTAPWNLTGQPALSVPCGYTPDQLPAGLQIVGRPFDEATVLRVGHAYQGVTAWHERRAALTPA